MKTIRTLKRTLLASAGLTALAMLCPMAQADPPEKDKLPPGLQKKDKLPPGWQKKVGKQGPAEAAASAPATNAAPSAPTTAKAPETPAPPASKPAEPAKETAPTTAATPQIHPPPAKPLTKEQQQRQTRLEKLLGEFESASSQPAATERVLGRLARVTNTPEAKLREQWQAHAGVTVSQFYLASIIAKRSRSQTEQVLSEHKSGRSWSEVAVARKVSIADLNEAVQEATAAARATTRDAERKAQRAATQ